MNRDSYPRRLNNLLDKKYYEGARGRLGIVSGPAFNAVVSAQFLNRDNGVSSCGVDPR